MPPIPAKNKKWLTYQNPRTGLSALQKKQVMKLTKKSQESKRVGFAGGYGNFKDGNYYMINPLYNISQGQAATQRIGQQITLDSIEVTYSVQLANAGVSLRAIAYWSDVESITSSTTPTEVTNANILATLPLIGATSSGLTTLMPFDKFQCTKLRDVHWDQNTTYSGQANMHTGKLLIKFPMGKKVTYLSDNASYFEGKNLYVGFAGTANATVNSTALGTVYQTTLVTFRE